MTLWRLARYTRPHLAQVGWAYVCMFVFAMCTAFLAFLTGPALQFVFSGSLNDVLREQNGTPRSVWQWLPNGWLAPIERLGDGDSFWVVPTLLVAVACVKGVAQTGQLYLLGRTSQNILQTLRRDAFAALLSQPPRFFEKRTHGDLLSRLTHDANLVEQAVFNGCGPILRDTLSVLALLAFCFATDSTLSLLTFITVPLALLPLTRFSRWLKRVSRRGQAAQGAINGVCYEALSGIRVVQAFGAEGRELQRLQEAASLYGRDMRLSYFIRAIRTPTMEIMGTVALAGLIALLGVQVQRNQGDAAHYISFFAAIVMMYDPLKKLGNVSDYLAAGSAACERLFEIIDLPPQVRDHPDAKPITGICDAVRFCHVGFAYNREPVLHDIDLTLQKGQRIALVGHSGAGKSTMAHMLLRFFDPTSGAIEVDGIDMRRITLASLRQHISVVGQDTFLFNCSVADNIRYGRHDASRHDIEAAATAAYATEFIDALPAGYDTPVGEQGVMLSGGQRQRLAIARALLRDAPLLILDEATSHLDVESEQYVQAALVTLLQNRTALIIAHRLSTVREADAIAVLRQGRIVEFGTHTALCEAHGEYARLYALQFGALEGAPLRRRAAQRRAASP